jgi:hypothetical protein
MRDSYKKDPGFFRSAIIIIIVILIGTWGSSEASGDDIIPSEGQYRFELYKRVETPVRANKEVTMNPSEAWTFIRAHLKEDPLCGYDVDDLAEDTNNCEVYIYTMAEARRVLTDHFKALRNR